jgi:glycosyltransferase involved in cell wall biosynthesis
MHILLLNRWFPPETGGGGVASHNAFFAASAVHMGHRVTVIASGRQRSAAQTADGVVVHRLTVPVLHKLRRIPLLGRFERALSMLLYSRRAAELIDSLADKPDLIEAADINAEAFALSPSLPTAIRCHTPTFLLEASDAAAASFRSDARLLIWAERRALRKALAFSAPSHDLARRVIDHAGIRAERMAAIPNALDTRFFTPGASKRAESPAILWVGRLDPGKGLWVFADAVERLLTAAPHARFIVVGGGRRLEDLSNTADLLRARFADAVAAGRVDLRGFVPDEALPAVYHEADIAVVPSLIYESFSYTCAQAMASGLPVVASAVGGIPETLAGGKCGILIPLNDADALADALLRLIRAPALRHQLGAAGRARAVESFDMHAVTEALIAWYRRWIC